MISRQTTKKASNECINHNKYYGITFYMITNNDRTFGDTNMYSQGYCIHTDLDNT